MRRWLAPAGLRVGAALLLGASATSGDGESETTDPLPTAANDVRPLLVGAQVPPAVLTDAAGKPVDLKARMARRPTILVFYRGGW